MYTPVAQRKEKKKSYTPVAERLSDDSSYSDSGFDPNEANSFGGLFKETVKGIPASYWKLQKGAFNIAKKIVRPSKDDLKNAVAGRGIFGNEVAPATFREAAKLGMEKIGPGQVVVRDQSGKLVYNEANEQKAMTFAGTLSPGDIIGKTKKIAEGILGL